MEKDIGKIKKNDNTDIVVRIDDFGGKTGLTIREFVNGGGASNYSGFTKSGTRIPAEKFLEFREIINCINLNDLKSAPASASEAKKAPAKAASKQPVDPSIEDY